MPLDADAGAEEDKAAARMAGLLEVWDINDDNYTSAVGEGDDDAHAEQVGWGVGSEAGDGSNGETGGAPAVDLTEIGLLLRMSLCGRVFYTR